MEMWPHVRPDVRMLQNCVKVCVPSIEGWFVWV
jgi:hypothetical protein